MQAMDGELARKRLGEFSEDSDADDGSNDNSVNMDFKWRKVFVDGICREWNDREDREFEVDTVLEFLG
jgi:hypothetical protein